MITPDNVTMSDKLRPLVDFPANERAGVRFVLFDIDDTLTTEGQLTSEAYCALEKLKKSGLITAAITGRPAGWCDHIARMWPVDGVIGENGAFYYRYDHTKKSMVRCYTEDDTTRAQNRQRLEELGLHILQEIPGTAISSDQFCREADLAIDFCEDVPPLAQEKIDHIVQLFEEVGAHAKISSIHVNGWFGDYDKLAMTREFLSQEFGSDVDADNRTIVFAGDSPNDAPMFGFFENAVGVANILEVRERLDAEPAYVTTAQSGAGFAELAEAILAVR
jgi:HAD superfamily hydrolase (TIGR01484 family)